MPAGLPQTIGSLAPSAMLTSGELHEEQMRVLAQLDDIDRACLEAAYRGLTSKEMNRSGIPRSKSTIDARLSTISRMLGAHGRHDAGRLYVEFARRRQQVAEELPTHPSPVAAHDNPTLADPAGPPRFGLRDALAAGRACGCRRPLP